LTKQTAQARHSLELSERAWLAVVLPAQLTIRPDGTIQQIYIEAKNSGHTPALSVELWSHYALLEKLPASLNLNALGGLVSSGVIAPNASGRFPPEAKRLSPDETATMNTRSRTLYFIGHVVYRDIFGNPHRTVFCRQFDPANGEFFYCPRFNTMD
jgi:hypothetical protein